jgi:hypothetical protein
MLQRRNKAPLNQRIKKLLMLLSKKKFHLNNKNPIKMSNPLNNKNKKFNLKISLMCKLAT